MCLLASTVATLSTFYREADHIHDAENRLTQIKRLIAKVRTIAAFSYRHSRDLPDVYPDNDLSYTGNFLAMMCNLTETNDDPNLVLEFALDRLILG